MTYVLRQNCCDPPCPSSVEPCDECESVCPPNNYQDPITATWPETSGTQTVTLNAVSAEDYIAGYNNWNPTSGPTYFDWYGCGYFWRGQYTGFQGLEALTLRITPDPWVSGYWKGAMTFEFYTIEGTDSGDYGTFYPPSSWSGSSAAPSGWLGDWEFEGTNGGGWYNPPLEITLS